MTAARRPLRPIPWWMVVIGVLIVIATAWICTTWLLAEADQAIPPDRAGPRIEAIRTGLGVGAGTGGALALLLAVRRQWLNERSQVHWYQRRSTD